MRIGLGEVLLRFVVFWIFLPVAAGSQMREWWVVQEVAERGAGSGDTPATATCAGSSPAAVAAHPCLHRRRCLPATDSVAAGAGILHKTVNI